jgi:hypothetical protein
MAGYDKIAATNTTTISFLPLVLSVIGMLHGDYTRANKGEVAMFVREEVCGWWLVSCTFSSRAQTHG